MKFKAILFAVSIFGATFFVTSTPEYNSSSNEELKEQAVDRRLIRIPLGG